MVEAISFVQYLRIEAMIAPKIELTTRTQRDLAQRFHALQTELLQAYMELRLVANPDPLAVGDEAFAAVADLLPMGTAKQETFDRQLELATETQRAFTEACRADLWYLPQPWQVYRPAWWSARRSRKASGQPPAIGAPADTSGSLG